MDTNIIDLQAARGRRQAAQDRAEARRIGFASASPALQALAFSVANEDWDALEALLGDDANDGASSP